MAKKFQIKSQDQKLVPFEKEYLFSDWTSDANIWITDIQKSSFTISTLDKLLHAEKCSIFNTDIPLSS